MSDTSCDDVARNEWAARYVNRVMSSQEREQFEAHFIDCERCQREIELAAALKVAMKAPGASTTLGRDAAFTARAEIATPAAPRRWRAAGAVAAAAVLVIAVALVKRPRAPTDVPAWGTVSQAPIYLGVPVRDGTAAASDSLFEVAMQSYSAERFADAARALREAIAGGATHPPAHFFLGASLLMSGQPRDATTAFDAVLAAGDSPYRVEAYYYRAKCLLQLGDRERAIADLAAAAAERGEAADQARALRDSVSGAAVRP
jgi:TolA-binding protein